MAFGDRPHPNDPDQDAKRDFVVLGAPQRARKARDQEPAEPNDLRWERPKRLAVRRVLLVTLTVGLVFAIILLHSASSGLELGMFDDTVNEARLSFNAFEIIIFVILCVAWIVHAAMVVKLLSAQGGRKTAAGFHIALLVGWMLYLALFASDSHAGFVTGLLLPFLWIVAPMALIDGLADRPSWRSFWGDVFD